MDKKTNSPYKQTETTKVVVGFGGRGRLLVHLPARSKIVGYDYAYAIKDYMKKQKRIQKKEVDPTAYDFQIFAVGIADNVLQPHWGVWAYRTIELGAEIETKMGSECQTSGNRMTMFAINSALVEIPAKSTVCIHTDNKYVQAAYDHCRGKVCFKANLDLISDFYELVNGKELEYAIIWESEEKRGEIYDVMKTSVKEEYHRISGGMSATDMKRYGKDEDYAKSIRQKARTLRNQDPQTHFDSEVIKYANNALSTIIAKVPLPKECYDVVHNAIKTAYIEGKKWANDATANIFG